jgi:hypothetical protein
MIALGNPDRGAAEATDWMKPPGWTGNFWGPAATRARATGQLPPLPTDAAMTRWRTWGRDVLKPEHRDRIPGVIGYCRSKFEQQVPFDYGFRPDDAALYCVELTEKAFRSQGLVLSQPVRIGDWENLGRYPLTALATPYVTRLMLEQPITLEQPVYVPGNERHGVWASSLLKTVFGPEPKSEREAAPSRDGRLSLRGDLELAVFAAGELRRSGSPPQVSPEIRVRSAVAGEDRRPENPPIASDVRVAPASVTDRSGE